jgi:DNA polymerase-3 subunit gamma/tau
VCEACVSISSGRCLDVIEIDAASNRGVEDIRMLRERVNYAAGTVRRKVYIVDEVHMLTDPASNALLKTLEEPPPHVMFILATTEFHKVLPTIVSRCQSFHFRRLTLHAIAAKLQLVCEREGIEADAETLAAIAHAAGGSLRDAENVLQQLMASCGGSLVLEEVQRELGIGDDEHVLRLIASLEARDLAGGLRVLHQVSDDGIDMRNFGRQVVSTLRDLLVVQSGCDDILESGAERRERLRALAGVATVTDVARAARRFAETTARDASQPLLALELAVVDCVVGREEGSGKESSRSDGAGTGRLSDGARRSPSRAKTQGPAAPVAAAAASAAADGPPATAAAPAADSASTPGQAPAGAGDAGDGEHAAPPEVVEAQSGALMEESVSPAGEEVVEELVLGELGHVRALWKEYVDSLRGLGSTGNLDAFLRSACEPISLEDDVLVLRFAYEFHKSKVEDPKYRHVVEERLQQFYGRPFKVACVLESSESETPAATGSSPAREENVLDAAMRMGARPKKQG